MKTLYLLLDPQGTQSVYTPGGSKGHANPSGHNILLNLDIASKYVGIKRPHTFSGQVLSHSLGIDP